jgi:hypothetical protein
MEEHYEILTEYLCTQIFSKACDMSSIAVERNFFCFRFGDIRPISNYIFGVLKYL